MAHMKYLRSSVLLAVLVGISAVFFTFQWTSTPQEPRIFGQNNTVLFLTNHEYGLTNVHLATAVQLARSYPDLEVHYASFEPMKKKLERANAHARGQSTGVKPFKWHQINGTSAVKQMSLRLGGGRDEDPNITSHGPGLDSLDMTIRTQATGACPWSGEEAWDLYEQVVRIIQEVDPAVIVLDVLFSPAWDATRSLNRAHVVLTPNDLITMLADWQPRGAMFWKYPSWSSGLPYPLPWKQIPLNIYLRTRAIFAVATNSGLWETRRVLQEKGVKSPLSFLGVHRPDVPWIAMSVPEASVPLMHRPPNVTECGAIVLDMGGAEDQDPKLAAWLKRRRTVLVNFGTLFLQKPPALLAMVEALDKVLAMTEVQVLWKVGKEGMGFQDERWKQILDKWSSSDRLRVVDWVRAEPSSMLKTGDVVLSVHHGGASSYYDAVLAGVPQLILPQWSDHYTFASTSEYLGIGIWGSKETSPRWDAEFLARDFMLALEGEKSDIMRSKARELGVVSLKYGGSKCAAGIIAGMAAKGRSLML